MYSRTIRSQTGNYTLQDLLISVFVTELMHPSEEVYLISPYLSNVPMIDNQLETYSDLFPMVRNRWIYLSDILLTLAWKGSSVRVICDPDRPESQGIIAELRDQIEMRKLQDNHEKGLFTERIYLHGSMNFTYRGVYVNLESVRTTFHPSEVHQNLIAARGRWEEAEII